MKILVTAGNTQTVIDRVRCITNVFSGRTGAQIAAEAFERGHAVTLVTSHPEVLTTVPAVTRIFTALPPGSRFHEDRMRPRLSPGRRPGPRRR